MIVEIAGPPASGKSCLSGLLCSGNAVFEPASRVSLATARDIALVVGHSLKLTPILLRCGAGDRWCTPGEVKGMVYLNSWHQVLRRQAADGRHIVVDQGALFYLTSLYGFGPSTLRSPELETWWDSRLRCWARTLNLIVWLDAPDEVLVDRIRVRSKAHSMKDKPTPDVTRFLAAYRESYEHVVGKLVDAHAVEILRFDTSQTSVERMASEVTTMLEKESARRHVSRTGQSSPLARPSVLVEEAVDEEETQPASPEPFGASWEQRVKRSGFWGVSRRIGGAVTALALNALLARLLSPKEMGAYFLIMSLVMVTSKIGLFGIPEAAMRLLSESLSIGHSSRVRRIVGSSFLYGGIGGSVIVALLLFGGGRWLATSVVNSDLIGNMLGVAAIWSVLIIFRELIEQTFRGLQDFGRSAMFGGLLQGALGCALFGGLWAWRGTATLSQVLLVIVLTLLFNDLFALGFLRGKLLGSDALSDGWSGSTLLSIAWPLWLNQLAVFILGRVNLWVLAVSRTEDEVALYGAALNLAQVVILPLLIVGTIVPPFIAEMNAQGKLRRLEAFLRSGAGLAAVPTLIAATVFVVFGAAVLELVYGQFYRQAAVALTLLSIGQLINVWTGACAPALKMTGYQRVLMKTSIFFALMSVIGAVLVADRFGIEGVAGVTATMLALQNLATLALVKKKLGIWTHAQLLPGAVRRGLKSE